MRLFQASTERTVWQGDCLTVMASWAPDTFDSIVSDPPYGLSFMGKAWDRGVPGVPFWSEALRVAKPGAHLVAFGGTRTHHRLMVAIEDAGWEIRDCLMWLYGSGFPKSLDVSKAIDKRGGAEIAWFGPFVRAERERRGITQKELALHFPSRTGGLTGCVANWELGFNLPTPDQFNTLCRVLDLPFADIAEAERDVVGHSQRPAGWFTAGDGHDITAPATDAARQWQGWGTALKPAWEPIILARKPLIGTVASNVQAHGTGAINVDGCRVEMGSEYDPTKVQKCQTQQGGHTVTLNVPGHTQATYSTKGRWPANVLLDDESAALLDAATGDLAPGGFPTRVNRQRPHGIPFGTDETREHRIGTNSGGASRFFYTSKASRSERNDWIPTGEKNAHATVKPVDLMRWLVRLVTPLGGHVLDPFCGSGSTGVAAGFEGMAFTGIELDEASYKTARQRLGLE